MLNQQRNHSHIRVDIFEDLYVVDGRIIAIGHVDAPLRSCERERERLIALKDSVNVHLVDEVGERLDWIAVDALRVVDCNPILQQIFRALNETWRFVDVARIASLQHSRVNVGRRSVNSAIGQMNTLVLLVAQYLQQVDEGFRSVVVLSQTLQDRDGAVEIAVLSHHS